jgi:hypothetical protein
MNRKSESSVQLCAALVSSCIVAFSAPGQTWIQSSAPSNSWRAIAISANGTKIGAGADTFPGDGLLYTSSDSGETWLPSNVATGRWDSVVLSADGLKLVASVYNKIYFSSDFGTNWALSTNLLSFRSLASSGDGTRLVAGGGGTYISADSGATWNWVTFGGYCVASSADGLRLVMAYFAYPGHLEGGIFISTNAGAAWIPTSAPLDLTTGWNSLVSSADGKKLAATIGYTDWPTGPGPLYLSHDGGATWLPSSSPTSHWFSIASSADGTRLIASGQEGLFTSTDSGSTWVTNWPPGLTRTSVASSADGSKLAAAIEGGRIYIAQSVPTPTLNLTRSDSGVLVSWTVPSLDFKLQTSSDLDSPNWANVTNTVRLNLTNLQNEVVVSISNTNQFYRLKY